MHNAQIKCPTNGNLNMLDFSYIRVYSWKLLVWGSGCIDPHFLDLGTSWRLVVSFTTQLLYPRGKSLVTH
jgi:hypothetical protein